MRLFKRNKSPRTENLNESGSIIVKSAQGPGFSSEEAVESAREIARATMGAMLERRREEAAAKQSPCKTCNK